MTNIFEEYPFCRNDRAKLKAVLMDVIPTERAKIHLLLHAYDEGIKQAIDEALSLDSLFSYRWIKRMVESCGSSRENAEWAVHYWVENYGIQCLKKSGTVGGTVFAKEDDGKGSSIPDIDFERTTRTMPIIFAIDTSIATYGEIIGCLYQAIHSLLPELRDLQENQIGVNYALRVLSMSSEPRWQQDSFVSVEKFCLDDLEAKGYSCVGKSFDILAEQLDNIAQADAGKILAPTIVFVFSSIPNDDYCNSLERLRNTRLFKKSIRIAVAVGTNVDEHLMEQLTGSRELIIDAASFDFALIRMLNRYHS